jgi:hypothetical protein
MDFLKKLKSFKEFVGTYITFLKGYDASFLKNSKLSMNFPFEKNFGGALAYMRGAADFGPCTFLVPPILTKLVFLDSVRTKLSESDPLS